MNTILLQFQGSMTARWVVWFACWIPNTTHLLKNHETAVTCICGHFNKLVFAVSAIITHNISETTIMSIKFYFPAVILTHDGPVCSIHCTCGSSAHYHLLLCWECVLCYTQCHLMPLLPSWFDPLWHALWIYTRSWIILYLQYHNNVLARWSCSWYKCHSCQCSQANRVWRFLFRQHCNSCSQWVSWLFLPKYGGVENLFLSFYIQQQEL